MNFAQRYWEDWNGELLQRALVEQLPANQRGIDRRGFEWFYWQRRMSSGHTTLKGHTAACHERGVRPRRQATRLRQHDGTVKVWDTATGRTSAPSRDTPASLSVAFSPDGRRIASAGEDLTVKVWDAATGKEILTLTGHTAWSERGVQPRRQANRLRRMDETVKVWDAATGHEILTLEGHTEQCLQRGVQPRRQADRSRLGRDGEGLGRRRPDRKSSPSRVPGCPGRGVQPRRQAARLATRRQIKVWDAMTGHETPHPHGAHTMSPAWRSAPMASGSPPPVRMRR